MPLPFDFEGKGVLDFAVAEPPSSSSCSLSSVNPLLFQWKENWNKESCFLGREQPEPTSVLETIGSLSPPTSSSTLSSSFDGGGGGGSTETAGVAAVSGNPSQKWQEPTTSSGPGLDSELHPVPPLLGAASAAAAAAAPDKCGLGIDDWEGVLSESVAASPTQEQSILRWIMGDVDDPSMGLNKLLQTGAPPELEFPTDAFGVGDHRFGSDPVGSFFPSPNLMPPAMNPSIPTSGFPQNPIFSPLSSNLVPPLDVKPQIFSPQVLINQHQALNPQNPSFFLPYAQQENHLFSPPQPKRHNPGGLELNPPMLPHPFQLLPSYGKPKILDHELGQNQNQNHNQNHQQAIIDQIFKAAELVQTGNSALAQGILARLNHQLSPIGKPFHRAAFFCKEALQNSLNPASATSLNSSSSSPFNLILKIGAYKSFSEVSPLIQFANFTCNQAMLEVLEGFNRIHVVDFDIGYGGQWASLMQELALRSCGAPSLKITAFASPSTHDQLELGLTRENLIHFAGEVNMAFEFDILSLDSLSTASWSLPLRVSENEAVAVNLPVGSFSNYQLSLPMILGLVKQLAPKIVVSVDRGCDRMDLPFPAHVIHALQSYSNLLESIDAVNVNPDAMQKIERFLLQPGIEKIVMARCRSPEKSPHWRSLFLSSGFSPLALSNFAESQAECVVKRTPVRGFHVEKRQSSLVLCWQQKELISASAWRC